MRSLPPEVAGVRWRRASGVDVDGFFALILRIDAVDDPGHPLPRGELDAMLAASDLREHLVLGEEGGALVAFAWRRRPGDGSVVRLIGGVRPDRRGRGVGRGLVAWQLEDARRHEPDAVSATLRQAARSDVAGLARRQGFAPERVFLALRRSTEGPPEAPGVPAPLRTTGFEPALDEAVRLARNEAFQDHWHAAPTTRDQWRLGQLGPGLRREASRVALDPAGAVAGFALLHEVDGPQGDAYVPLVGTARAWRGRGVARALLAEVVRRAGGAGYPGVALDVDSSSPTGADRLYAGLGFTEASRATVWSRALPAPAAAGAARG